MSTTLIADLHVCNKRTGTKTYPMNKIEQTISLYIISRSLLSFSQITSNHKTKTCFSLSTKPNMATMFSLLFLLVTLLAIATSTPTNFIESSCSTTQYPTLCVESLSVYASTIQQDPHQLVQTALSLSLNRTQSTKAFVRKCKYFKNLKPIVYAAIHDCVEVISDGVDRLSSSLKELKLCKTNGQDFTWHISNVETWVSSALTDGGTCSDGFGGKELDGRIKTSIRSRIVDVAQVTSNALALINQYAVNH